MIRVENDRWIFEKTEGVRALLLVVMLVRVSSWIGSAEAPPLIARSDHVADQGYELVTV